MVYDIERARFCEHFNASPYRRHVTKNFCRYTDVNVLLRRITHSANKLTAALIYLIRFQQIFWNLILITYERQHNFQRSRQPHLQLSSTTAVKTSVQYQNIAIPSRILIGTFKFLASRLNDKQRKKRFVVRYYDQQQSHFTHKNGRKLLITAGLEHGLCHGDALLTSYLA